MGGWKWKPQKSNSNKKFELLFAGFGWSLEEELGDAVYGGMEIANR